MVNLVAPWRYSFERAFGVLPEPDVREKFLRNCTPVEGGCWVWSGDKAGVKINRRRYPPQYVAQVLFRYPVEDGVQVRAACGNNCCLPAHLECFTETMTAAS